MGVSSVRQPDIEECLVDWRLISPVRAIKNEPNELLLHGLFNIF